MVAVAIAVTALRAARDRQMVAMRAGHAWLKSANTTSYPAVIDCFSAGIERLCPYAYAYNAVAGCGWPLATHEIRACPGCVAMCGQ
jgi:hypothetical protein